MPTTDPDELRRRADILSAQAEQTPDDVLASHLLLRAVRLQNEATLLEAEAQRAAVRS